MADDFAGDSASSDSYPDISDVRSGGSDDTGTGGTAGPGESQGGDRVDPDTGEIGGGSADDDDSFRGDAASVDEYPDYEDVTTTTRDRRRDRTSNDRTADRGYDGAKTFRSGPEHTPDDPTDRFVVLDEAGDEGRPVFSRGDDPFTPDADSRGVEERENLGNFGGEQTDDTPRDRAVERVQSRISRNVPGINAVDTDAYNITETETGYAAVLTDLGIEQYREATGQTPEPSTPTVAETGGGEDFDPSQIGRSGVSVPETGGGEDFDPGLDDPRDVAEQQLLEEAGLAGVAGASSYVSITRSGNEVQASLAPAGQRASVRQRFARQQNVDPDAVSVTRTPDGTYRAEVTGDPTAFQADTGEIDLEGAEGIPPTRDVTAGTAGEGQISTRAALSEELAAVRTSAYELEPGEVFSPTRAPDNPAGNPVTGAIQGATGAPGPEEIQADIQAASVFRGQGDIEANTAAEINRAFEEETGVNPRQGRADVADVTRERTADVVEYAQENPGRAVAVGLPASLAEPTIAGEAAILGGAAAGVIGYDLAARVGSDRTPANPLTGEELPAPQEAPGQQGEIEQPERPGNVASEFEVPEDRTIESTRSEIQQPERIDDTVAEITVPEEDTARPDPDTIRTGATAGETGPAPTRPGQPTQPGGPTLPDPTDDIQQEIERDYTGERGGVRTFGEEATEPEVQPEQEARDLQAEIEQSLAQGLGGADAGPDGLSESFARELGLAGGEVPSDIDARARVSEESIGQGDAFAESESIGDATVGTGTVPGVRTGEDVTSLGRGINYGDDYVEIGETTQGYDYGDVPGPGGDSSVPGPFNVPIDLPPDRRSRDEDFGDIDLYDDEIFSSGIADVEDLLNENEQS